MWPCSSHMRPAAAATSSEAQHMQASTSLRAAAAGTRGRIAGPMDTPRRRERPRLFDGGEARGEPGAMPERLGRPQQEPQQEQGQGLGQRQRRWADAPPRQERGSPRGEDSGSSRRRPPIAGSGAASSSSRRGGGGGDDGQSKAAKKEKKGGNEVERDSEGFALKCQHKTLHTSLDKPREVAETQVLKFERLGWVVTRGMFSKKDFQQLQQQVQQHVQKHKLDALRQRLRVLRPDIQDPLSIKTEQQAMQALKGKELGFLQFFNSHRTTGGGFLKKVILGVKLGGTAAQLLGASAVRVYQDCIFLKQPGFSETNWHSDLRMAPFDTNAAVTAWIPMRIINGTEEDSGLLFAEGSHKDYALPFWHDVTKADLEGRYTIASAGTMEMTDVSWHHGWTVHSAGPQPPGTAPRAALAVTFIADGARLQMRPNAALHDEDRESYAAWIEDLQPGDVASHELLPVTFKSEDVLNPKIKGRFAAPGTPAPGTLAPDTPASAPASDTPAPGTLTPGTPTSDTPASDTPAQATTAS